MKIREDEIHLWCLFDNNVVKPHYLKLYAALISQSERMEMGRLLFSRNRRQFLLARVLARTVLSLYFPCVRPGAWAFGRSADGRPYILKPLGIPLDFNISHTDGLIILGISKDRTIGVDAECLHRRRRLLENAQMFCSPEEVRELESLPVQNQLRRAYQFWTLKESFQKAHGVGRSPSVKALKFNLSKKNGINFWLNDQSCDAHNWRFWQFAPSDSHEVAIALQPKDGIDDPVSLRLYSINPLQKYEEIFFPIVNRDASSLL